PLVTSYNTGYQSVIKDLKPSARQRFIVIEFDYPPEKIERQILIQESGVDQETADLLVRLGHRIRKLKEFGLEEGVSTRLLVYTARLIKGGINPFEACKAGLAGPVTDELEMKKAIIELIKDFFSD
ncbi:MAG: CbbQ/NirQ/NorQ C-terminal domain-containing protein, partial [Deltaproteobacteria bacterium]|nr:CbbQ/NirQ/NorQ C-terminal domain-containing protein [Deltaproteobacteria bacterium]